MPAVNLVRWLRDREIRSSPAHNTLSLRRFLREFTRPIISLTSGERDKLFFLQAATVLRFFRQNIQYGGFEGIIKLVKLSPVSLKICPSSDNPWYRLRFLHYLANGLLEFIFAILQNLRCSQCLPYVCFLLRWSLLCFVHDLVERVDLRGCIIRYSDVLVNGLIRISVSEDKMNYHLIWKILNILHILPIQKRIIFYEAVPIFAVKHSGFNPEICSPIDALHVELFRMVDVETLRGGHLFILFLPDFSKRMVRMACKLARNMVIRVHGKLSILATHEFLRSSSQMHSLLNIIHEIFNVHEACRYTYSSLILKLFKGGLPILMKILVSIISNADDWCLVSEIVEAFYFVLRDIMLYSNNLLFEAWYTMYTSLEREELRRICQRNPEASSSSVQRCLERLRSASELISEIDNSFVSGSALDAENQREAGGGIRNEEHSERSRDSLEFDTWDSDSGPESASILTILTWEGNRNRVGSDSEFLHFSLCYKVVSAVVFNRWPDRIYISQLNRARVIGDS